jgi:hypothetical protein
MTKTINLDVHVRVPSWSLARMLLVHLLVGMATGAGMCIAFVVGMTVLAWLA